MDKELDEWKEKCHHLNLRLNTLQQNHQTEVEFLKDELTAKEKELKSIGDTLRTDFSNREKKLKEQISELQDFLQESRDQCNVVKGQAEQQQRSIEQLRALQNDRQFRNEVSESQKIREEQLTQELKSSRNLLETQQTKLHDLIQVTEQQKEMISNLQEEMDAKDLCLKQLQTRTRELENERAEEEALAQALQIQNHIAEEDSSGDPSKRGNSLFSELEERRVRVEDELVRLRGRVARLTVENLDLKSSLERGDSRSAITLMQLQVIERSETELAQALRQLKSETLDLFQSYEDRFTALTNEYNRKLLQFRNGLDPDYPQPPELEVVRAERDRLLAQKVSQDRELFECRKQLKLACQQRTAAEANVKILRVKLQALQEQFNKPSNNNGEANASDNSLNSSSSGCGSLNNSLNTTAVRNRNCGGDVTISNDEDWIRHNILEETTLHIKQVASAPKPNSATSNQNHPTTSTAKKTSRSEEIPECNQQ